MKQILLIPFYFFGYLIYHRTNDYRTTTIEVIDLHYEMYHLYRVDKFLLFIPIHRLVEKANSLGNSKLIRNKWFYNYPNLKEGF